MIDIPDDPIIARMMRNGVDSSEPICPVCGGECNEVYKDSTGEILGCDNCLTAFDAWEEDECMRRWFEE